MQPEVYYIEWTSKGNIGAPAGEEKLFAFKLLPSTKDFLRVGLPDEAAPFLSFVNNIDDHRSIGRLNELYDQNVDFGKYVFIGTDGEGNPIVINTSEYDQIEWLDHEDNFKARYCNQSIASLLNFLIIYRDFVSEMIAENGEDAFLDAKFTDDQFDYLKHKMLIIDSRAVDGGSFWDAELQTLLANRRYYQNQ